MVAQARKLALTSRAFYNSVLGEYEEFVTRYFGYDKVLPMNSGAEADETALSCAANGHTKRKELHRAMQRSSVVRGIFTEGRSQSYPCRPILMQETITVHSLPGFITIPYNDLNALEEALKDPDVAGFLVEPIQVRPGFSFPTKDI
jgi:ornithine--oxo-acid transaminase